MLKPDKLNVDLYAPASFIAADQAVRDAVSNGCGAGGWLAVLVPETFYGLDISPACDIHDWMYAEGITIEEKHLADRAFRNNLLRLISAQGGMRWLQWLRRRRAIIYYSAVKNFGGPAYWHKKNKPEETWRQYGNEETLLPV